MRTDALRDFLAHIAMTIPRLWGGERRLLTRGRPRLRFAVELLEDRCTPTIYIRSVPFIINAPGTYALAGDLNYGSLTGTAITIGASNVVVDLAGHKLWTSAGLGTTATGIAANDQANVTVRNGTLRGFQFGIRLVGEDGYGNRAENLQLNNITYNSIWVDGTGSVVENNRILDTGGCNISGYAIEIAIHVAGPGSEIIHNHVTNFVWSPGITQEVVGLALDDALGPWWRIMSSRRAFISKIAGGCGSTLSTTT